MGIDLGPDDWAIRCNLMTILDGKLTDFTAGHITSAEGQALIESIQAALGRPGHRVSARRELPQPVDLSRPARRRALSPKRPSPTRRTITPASPPRTHLPRGPGSMLLRDLMHGARAAPRRPPGQPGPNQSGQARRRMRSGSGGRARRPSVPRFAELHRQKGAIISAVDLVRGVGAARRLDSHRCSRRDRLPRHRLCRQGPLRDSRLSKTTTSCACTSRRPTRPATRGATQAKVEALERIDQDIVGPVLRSARPSYDRWRHPDLAGPFDAAQHPRPRPGAGGLGDGRDRAARVRQQLRRGRRPNGGGPFFESGHHLMKRFLDLGWDGRIAS